MAAGTRTRHHLEPLLPAMLGFGLAHVLFGWVVWTLLPVLTTEKLTKTEKAAKLVWRAPDDFLLDAPPTKPAAKPLPVVPVVPAAVMKTAPVDAPASAPSNTIAASPSLLAAQIKNTFAMGGLMSSNTDALMNLGAIPTTINTLNPLPLTAPAVPPQQTSSPTKMAVAETDPVVSPITGLPASQLKEADKYITLSAIIPVNARLPMPPPGKLVLNLLDIAALNEAERTQGSQAGGADMGPVEKALQQAILREWKAPAIQRVPISQRRATLEIRIMRDGTVKEASMKTASGSQVLDASIREAATRVTKIPETLPSNFPKESYDLRVNFQIE